MTVNGGGIAEEPLVFRLAEMGRCGLTCGRKFEPIISFAPAIGIIGRASLRRLGEMTSRELGIDIRK